MTTPVKAEPTTNLRSNLVRIYAAAVSAVDPRRVIARALDGVGAGAEAVPAMIEQAAGIYLIAAGKAAAGMASETEARLDARLRDALVIAPSPGLPVALPARSGVRVMAAAHPLPDASSEAAGRAALEFAGRARPGDLVVVALSGGASALMVAPAGAVTLADKIAINAGLLRAGASIREINTVRKHLSAIKGGRLLQAIAPGVQVLSLILSDVSGNDLATIASGPTAADSTTYADAIAVLKRRGLWGRAPENVRDHLERGAAGEIAETLKRDDPALARVCNIIAGDNGTALEAAATAASSIGYEVERYRELSGEATDLGGEIAAYLCTIDRERVCVIAGGEPVVTLKGNGLGGRAQQSALAMAIELARIGRERRIAALIAGTDGIDGPTDAAGTIVTPSTCARAAEAHLDPGAALARNDAYPFFKALGDLLITGPTGTNVSDVFIALVNYGHGH
jgi:glycerate-2-kinase